MEVIGRNVTRFRPGDAVFGVCVKNPDASGVKVWIHEDGGFAEYACAPESALALKPENVSFEQAATAGVAGLTALQGLRDRGRIPPGFKVLINGAAGGVGTFAVQIAKSFGASVTAVCGTKNLEMVRSLGADRLVDYTNEDFTKLGEQYDLIFDCVSNHSLAAYRRILTPFGRLVMVGDQAGRSPMGILTRLTGAIVVSSRSHQKFITFLARPKQDDLAQLANLMRTEKLKPVIVRCYDLREASEAIRYLEQRHARGKVVIRMA